MGGDLLIAQGTGIGYQADFVLSFKIAAENVVAAVRKRPPDGKLCSGGIKLLKGRVRALSEKPARLVVECARLRLEIAAAKQERAGSEQRAVAAVLAALRQPYDDSVVGVAEHGDVSARIHDRGEVFDHRLDARFKRRREFLPVRLAGEQCKQQ